MTLKSTRNRKSERGNVFFTLFGAVAIVGVLGAGIMATMRGPLSTMVNVNRRTQAEAQLSIASKLAMLEAANQAASGDCDADGYIEPLEHGAAIPGFTGGGALPAAVTSNKLDPWGTQIGYCVWDAGPVVDPDVGECTGTRLLGDGTDNPSYSMLAVVSAGPDQTFQTSCANHPGLITKGGDDIVMEFDYATATIATGGLWNIKQGDPDVAEIDKDIEAKGATFGGAVDLTDPLAKLTLGAGSMLLPDQNQAQNGDCDAFTDSANFGILRVNTSTDPDTVEICDSGINPGTLPSWKSVAEGATSVSFWKNDGPGTPTEIYYSGGFVGIGSNNPAQPLDVTGNTHISDNLLLDATSAITWDGASSDPSITESASGLNVIANGGFGVTGNATITGTGADGSTNALLISNSTPTGLFVVENDGDVGIGVADPNDRLDITGSIDITDHYKLDGVNILTDNAATGTTILGKGTGTAVTGINNTILGAGAGGGLIGGKNNILIGSHDVTPITTPGAATDNFLNIGNTLYGDLTNDRVGIGTSTMDDALEVVGTIDATVDVHADGDVTAGDDVIATGDVSGVNVIASTRVTTDELYVNNTDNFIPSTCNSGSFNRWDGNNWECDADTGGSGGGTQNLAGVLGQGNDATTLDAENFGQVGSNEFCNEDLSICFDPEDVASGAAGSALSAITAATVDNTIGSAAWNQVWNWQLTAAETGFAFGETAASTGGAGDQFILAARTLAASTATPLIVTNLGAANSFRVNDETGDADATPFIIGPDGRVAIGTASLGQRLSVNGTIETRGGMLFNQGSAATDNLMYLGSTVAGEVDASFGFFAAGMGSSNAGDGAYFLARGNDFSGLGNQRGNMYFVAGNPAVPGAAEGSLNFFTGADTPRMIINNGGEVGIGDTTPDDGTGGGGQNLLLDVNGATGSTYFCDENGLNCFTAASVAGTGIWEKAGTVIRTRAPTVYATDDFVFGAAQLADIVGVDDDNRMFFDKSKGAFRAGAALSTQWDDASIGNYSAALGINTIASGNYSTALGASTTASGHVSTTMGTGNYASGDYSMAFGVHASVGSSVVPDGSGNGSAAFGLIDSAVTITVPPIVSGIQSMGIFMGDQDAVNVSASNIMALLGGRLVIDPDDTSAANTNVSTGTQQLELDVQGDIGAINYCDEAGNNCFTPASVASNRALSAITAATAGNSINNADHAQIWNWLLTTADKDAFTFTENTASTATGHSSILKAATLATSTATPLRVTNLGTADSFVVNDETGDADASPFVINAAGNVGIGTALPEAKLHVAGGDLFVIEDNGSGPRDLYVGEAATNWKIGLRVNSGNGDDSLSLFSNDGSINIVPSTGLHVRHTLSGTGDFIVNTDQFYVDTSTGNVGIGMTAPASRFVVASPTTEVVGAAATITANACGTVKQISATANRTTSTTDTFTAPTASYNGCCMDVVNVDTVDTITLDSNAKFFTGAGTDLALAPGKGVRVCSDGAAWYQAGGVSSATSASNALSALTAAAAANSINNADYAQVWNWQLTTADKDAFTFTENAASTATGHSSVLKAATLAASTATPLMVTNLGAANSFVVNDETGDADTTPFVIQADGDVGIGTTTPSSKLHIGRGSTTTADIGAIFLQSGNGAGLARDWKLYSDGTGNFAIRDMGYNNSGGGMSYDAFVIKYDGTVGIGTATPSTLLDMVGLGTVSNTAPHVKLSDAANALYGSVADTDNATGGTIDFRFGATESSGVFSRGFVIRDETSGVNRFFIDPSGNIGIGTISPASKFVVASPTAEVVGAAATITANSCGTVKQISATANRTTDTTDTFTAPTASYNGCCMDVVNIDTVDTITLDQNARFFTGAGTDLALAPGKAVRVCSDGTSWYQAGGVSSASAGTTALSGLTAAAADNSINNGNWNQVWNWQLAGAETAFTFGENVASAGGTTGASGNQFIMKASTLATSTATPFIVTNLGAANSFRVNDATGDTDTTPFVIDEAGEVGIGTATPLVNLQVHAATGAFPKMRLTAADVTTAVTSGSASVGDVSATNTIGQIRNRMDGGGVHTGGMLIQGFTGSGVNNHYPLHLMGMHGGTAPTTAAVTIGAQKWSGTNNRSALDGTTPILDIENNYSTAASGGLVMRVMGDGKVGIGTATPATNLHVASNAETFLFVDSAATNQWLNPTILGRRSRGTLASPTIVADDDELFAIGSYAYDGNSYEVGGYIGFYTDGTPGNADMPTRITLFTAPDGSATSLPRMTVNNAGNVGIGTTDPTAPFHIKKATDDWQTATLLLEGDGEPTLALQTSSAFDYYNPIIGTSRSRGSRAAKTAVASGDSLFEISTSGYDGSNDRVAFYMAAVVDGTVSGGGAADMPTRLEFHVQADGAGGGLEGTTPDMVIKNNGNVGIAMASPSVKLDVTGDIEYTGTIADVSDIRLKKDIHPLSERGSMLHKLGLIDTYSFKMKDSEVDQVEFGVMAQEIEKIFPELVRTADDEMGTKSVNYTGLIAPMIEAGKELEAQNKAMKAEIEALKARQDEMKQAMNEITEDMKGLKVHTGYGIGKAEMSLLMILAALGTLGAAGLARRRSGKPRQ